MGLKQTMQWAIYRAASPMLRAALEVHTPYGIWNTIHVHPELRYAYVANAKVASTTIKTVLINELRPDPDGMTTTPHDPSADPFARITDISRIRPLERLAASGTPFVAMVRNPFARLVSAYQSIIARPARRERVFGGFEIGPDVEPISFEEFVVRVCQMRNREMNNHWRVQHDQLLWGVIDYAFVGHLENPSDVATLLSMCGVASAEIPRRNSTGVQRDVGQYFSPELAQRVRDRYAADFDAFSYGPDPAELLPES